MKYSLVPVFILFYLKVTYSLQLLEDRCPEAEKIEPCTCAKPHGDRVITCQNVLNADDLRTAFQNVEGYNYHSIRIENSTVLYFPHEIVEKTPAKFLLLQDTVIVQIFDEPPLDVNAINEVSLHNSRISREVSWSFFLGFKNLTSLYVRNTSISILGTSFSKYMSKSLINVTFSHSNVNEIKPGALSLLSNLNRVTFGKCGLTNFTRGILPIPWNGQILELYDNRLTSIPVDLFTNMTKLVRIDLQRNFITVLPEAAFQTSVEKYLYLSGNPLKCDCQLRWILKKNLMVQKFYIGKCAYPRRLIWKYLHDLTANDFLCKELP